MNIASGIVNSLAAGWNREPPRSPLLGLLGPVKTAHLLPGRVRFVVPSLIGNHRSREIILEKVPLIDAVDAVEVNEISGSVLIRYQVGRIEPEVLFAVLVRLLGLEKELENVPQPTLAREIALFGKSLNRAVYEKTGGVVDLWTAFMIVGAVVGIRRIIANPLAAVPPGLTLLWWSFNSFLRDGERDV